MQEQKIALITTECNNVLDACYDFTSRCQLRRNWKGETMTWRELEELKNFNWCPSFGKRKRETGEEREEEKTKEEIEKRQVNKWKRKQN